ncbi:MAG: hypothetical protein HYV16_10970 [Gammaproteobacteria bacterium]|nr:hypothetical protein [Gammaproteobacteria bacterium]
MKSKRRYPRPKYRPFVQLSRRQRRELWIRLRWQIRRQAAQYGGRFTSHLLLDEPERPALYKQWFDFCFLGRDGRTIWNATLITARRAFWDALSSLAFDRAYALLSEAEREREFALSWTPVGVGRQRCYTMDRPEPVSYPQFGGLTWEAYLAQLEQQLLLEEPPLISESFRADPEYRYGIGWQGVINAEDINRETIEAAIAHFYEQGERDWQSPVPVERRDLPFETENAAYARLRGSGEAYD